eukprot:m.48689 g.48689  ORF g.48689 m.48689 type:complete len:561 (+) comp15266_c0_seq1:80-1762(+)
MEDFVLQDAVRFRFEPDGEEYMLATDVAKLLGKSLTVTKGLYPSLRFRKASLKERGYLQHLGYANTAISTIVKALDVEELLARKTSVNNTFSLIPDPIRTPRLDKGYCLTQSSFSLERPYDVQQYAKGRSGHTCANVLKKAFGTVGHFLHPGSKQEELVPIRLNLERDAVKYRDNFLWNKRDQVVTPHIFAVQCCHDEELPSFFVSLIKEAIEAQVAAYDAVAKIPMGNRCATIKLAVQVGSMLLSDSFHWAHSENAQTPETFAESLCADMGIGGAFPAQVAFSIREQLLLDRKSAVQGEEKYEDPVDIQSLSDCFVQHDGSQESWLPSLRMMSWSEIDRIERAADREQRRKKRGARDVDDGNTFTGRRSSRARKEVSYVVTKEDKRERLLVHNPQMLDVSADIKTVPVNSDPVFCKPQDSVVQHLLERRGVQFQDESRVVALSLKQSKHAQSNLGLSSTVRRVAQTMVTPIAATSQKGATVNVTFGGEKPRVGRPPGRPPGSLSATAAPGSYSKPRQTHQSRKHVKVYKDNYYNRKLGRVGMEKGTMGVSYNGGPPSCL